MPVDDFDDALVEAQEFISLARQQRIDGEPEEAEASLVAAVVTLEPLLPPAEGELQ